MVEICYLKGWLALVTGEDWGILVGGGAWPKAEIPEAFGGKYWEVLAGLEIFYVEQWNRMFER